MADPENIVRYAEMLEFPFTDEEIPLKVDHHVAHDWDWLAFTMANQQRITMPTAASACELVLPILYQDAPSDERPTLDTLKMLLDLSIRGGSSQVIENLDWSFWGNTWPMLEGRIAALSESSTEEILTKDTLVLASTACAYWLEHVSAMAQNQAGGIQSALDPEFIYAEMSHEDRLTATNRLLYERESLALSIVYSILALAAYHDNLRSALGLDYRIRFTWPTEHDWDPTLEPFFRIPFHSASQQEIAEILRKWLRAWWFYWTEKMSMATPYPEYRADRFVYIEPPDIPEEGPWSTPGVSFYLLDDDDED